jgi:hypothetical protein
VGGQRHTPAALPPGNTRHLLYRRLGGPQGLSGRVRNISPPPGFDPRTFLPVAIRYTDYAIPAQIYSYTLSLASALDGVGWSTTRLRSLYSRERPGTLCVRGWLGRSGLVRKVWPALGFYPRPVEPVASRYTA